MLGRDWRSDLGKLQTGLAILDWHTSGGSGLMNRDSYGNVKLYSTRARAIPSFWLWERSSGRQFASSNWRGVRECWRCDSINCIYIYALLSSWYSISVKRITANFPFLETLNRSLLYSRCHLEWFDLYVLVFLWFQVRIIFIRRLRDTSPTYSYVFY